MPTDTAMITEIALDETIGRAVQAAINKRNFGTRRGTATYTVNDGTLQVSVFIRDNQLSSMHWHLNGELVTPLKARELIGERIAAAPALFAQARAERAARRAG